MEHASPAFLRSPSMAPLRRQAYRGLWLAWFMANMTMWMHDVSAAWLMTQLTSSIVMVSLVQTAATLPVFVLGIPCGAAADIIDRRRYFAATQLWVCVTAALLAFLQLSGRLSAELLLLLTLADGVGLALRWPVFSAIVPNVVPRSELPAALALGSISMNLSRIIGPVVAGALLASAAPGLVFVLNTVLALVALWLVLRWKPEPVACELPPERFASAVRLGLQHVRNSPRMRVAIMRIVLFSWQSSALLALLPLIAAGTEGAGAGMFTAMMASMGVGAIVAALQFPRWRGRHDRDTFVRLGTLLHALASVVAAFVPSAWLSLPAMAVAGAAWMAVSNTLVVSAQLALPDWVRARGMSVYQVSLMGATALGAWSWGKLADLSSVPTSVGAAALSSICVLALTWRISLHGGRAGDDDLSPQMARPGPVVALDVQPEDGPVMVLIEYHVHPDHAAEFLEVMQATRRMRVGQGATGWHLFQDASQPGRYLEHFINESWLLHQRWLHRFTSADAQLRELRERLHVDALPPRVQRFVGARFPAEPLFPS